jgi:hypothetical protein
LVLWRRRYTGSIRMMRQHMGFEYQLRVTATDPEAIDAVLRQLPGARAGASGSGFDYGGDAGGWPEASARADGDGVYFIYYRTVAGGALFGALTVALVDAFGAVTVEEL